MSSGIPLEEFVEKEGSVDRDTFLGTHPAPFLVGQVGTKRLEAALLYPVRKKDGRDVRGSTPHSQRILLGKLRTNDIVIDSPRISQRHAYFSEDDRGRWFLADLNSNDGTWVGAEKLFPGRQVSLEGLEDTELRFGNKSFRFYTAAQFYDAFAGSKSDGGDGFDDPPPAPPPTPPAKSRKERRPPARKKPRPAPRPPQAKRRPPPRRTTRTAPPPRPQPRRPGPPPRPVRKTAEPAVWCLVAQALPGGFKTLPEGRSIVGRAQECDISLPHNSISKRHAEVMWRNGAFFLTDLESTNGTLVNDSALKGTCRLSNDDIITIGPFQMVFKRAVNPAALVEDDMEGTQVIDPWKLAMEAAERGGEMQPAELVKFCQILNIYAKDGVLSVTGSRGGEIELHQGAIVDARAGKLRDWMAVRALLAQEGKVKFQFRAGATNAKHGRTALATASFLSSVGEEVALDETSGL